MLIENMDLLWPGWGLFLTSSELTSVACACRLYGVVLGQPMMMVTELCPLGNLQDYLRKQICRISLLGGF